MERQQAIDKYDQRVEQEVDDVVDRLEQYLDEGRPYLGALEDAMYDVTCDIDGRWGYDDLFLVVDVYRDAAVHPSEADPGDRVWPSVDVDAMNDRILEAERHASNAAHGALTVACTFVIQSDIENRVTQQVSVPPGTGRRISQMHDFIRTLGDAEYVRGHDDFIALAIPRETETTVRRYSYDDESATWQNERGARIKTTDQVEIIEALDDLLNHTFQIPWTG